MLAHKQDLSFHRRRAALRQGRYGRASGLSTQPPTFLARFIGRAYFGSCGASRVFNSFDEAFNVRRMSAEALIEATPVPQLGRTVAN